MSWINANTKLFGLVGHNISYTLSPAIHNYIFQETGYNAIYLAFDIPEEKFGRDIYTIIDLCEGINITIPYKEKVIEFLNDIDHNSERIGAVNTIHRGRGYNTDYIAIKSLVNEKMGSIAGMICYIYGAGGAAKASAVALGDLGCKLFIVNRSVERAVELVRRLGRLGYEAYVGNTCTDSVDIVVNATPNPSYVHDSCLTAKLVVELVYTPVETILVRKAKNRGVKIVNGIEVLVRQAIESQKIWNGIYFPEDRVIGYLYGRKFIW
ncbi:MAG: shikimate dehydrogenase [Ignisphaera sp.]